MKAAPSIDVLLLSTSPRHHEQVLATFRARGLSAMVANTSRRALRMLASTPPLVLVDLAHPVDLSHDAVRTFNAERGMSVVVVLHEGSLHTHLTPLSELSVDGYCHARDWYPVTRMAESRGMNTSAMLH